MLRTEGKTIKANRGDEGSLDFIIPLKDSKGYLKYEDSETPANIYWYDKENNQLYDSNYAKSTVNINTLTQQFHEFEVDDVITFGIYREKQMTKPALLILETTVLEATDSVTINFTSEDMRFDSPIERETEYWYEVQLNHSQTIIGFFDRKPAKLLLSPEGSDQR